jgi:hypothetical protein
MYYEVIDKQAELDHAKTGIEYYQQGYLTRDGALFLYKVWVDDHGVCHPIWFIGKDALLNLLSHDLTHLLERTQDLVMILSDDIRRHAIPLTAIADVHMYTYLTDFQAYEESFWYVDPSEPEPYDDYHDLPFEELYSYFDGDPHDLAHALGEDWASSLGEPDDDDDDWDDDD